MEVAEDSHSTMKEDEEVGEEEVKEKLKRLSLQDMVDIVHYIAADEDDSIMDNVDKVKDAEKGSSFINDK